MPNWCDNSLRISHEDKSKVDALYDQLMKVSDPESDVDGVLDFLIPNPAKEWDYGWSVDNWGTKWDVHPEDFEREDDNTIHMNFMSAWSPPTYAYDKLVTAGWDIDAYYHEPGMAFCGHYADGDDQQYEIDFEDENWRNDIPEDVIDFAGLEYDYESFKENQEEEDADESKVD